MTLVSPILFFVVTLLHHNLPQVSLPLLYCGLSQTLHIELLLHLDRLRGHGGHPRLTLHIALQGIVWDVGKVGSGRELREVVDGQALLLQVGGAFGLADGAADRSDNHVSPQHVPARDKRNRANQHQTTQYQTSRVKDLYLIFFEGVI